MIYKLYRTIYDLKVSLRSKIWTLLFRSKSISIGKNISMQSFPNLWITGNGSLEIGNNVKLHRDIEIRVHKNAKIIIEDNVKLDRSIRLLATNDAIIRIGNSTKIGLSTVLNGGDSITIGKKVLISGFVYIQTSNHKTEGKLDIMNSGYEHGPITIGDEAWIAAHCTILPSISIGRGSVLASNAVATKDTEDYSINAGIPAKKLKERK